MNNLINAQYLFDSQYSLDIPDNEIIKIYNDSLSIGKNDFYLDEEDVFSKASILKWDTAHFGINMAKLEHLFIKHERGFNFFKREFNKWLVDNNIDYVTFRTNLLNRKIINHLLNNSFVILTNKYMLRIHKSYYERVKENIIVDQLNVLTSDIMHLAMASFNLGRFFNDPYISNEKSRQMYKLWLSNSLNNDNSHLLVKYIDSNLAGFVLFNQGIGYNSSIDSKLNHGFISLIATDKNYQGYGIGEKLLKSSLNKLFAEMNCEVVYANTDLQNISGLKLFQKANFKVFSVSSELRYINDAHTR